MRMTQEFSSKKSLLVVNSSPNLTSSKSRALTEYFIKTLNEKNPDQYLATHRDLGKNPLPYLDEKGLEVIMSDTLTTPQAHVTKKLVEELVAEIHCADLIVFGASMYNFTITAQLKTYFDHVTRSGMTFEYTSNGLRGLVSDKPVVILSTSGGFYSGTDQDHLVPYIKTILGFIGIKNVHAIAAEGLGMAASRESGFNNAKARIDQYTSHEF